MARSYIHEKKSNDSWGVKIDGKRDKRYDSTQWKRARKGFLRKNIFCVMCEQMDIETLATVVDHINPVSQGGEFWDRSNWQGLCANHHNSKSAKERNEKYNKP